MADASQFERQLLAAQNADGGWAYRTPTLDTGSSRSGSSTTGSCRSGSSWTEPTALALLALAACGSTGAHCQRAYDFLARTQRPDGGWPPSPHIPVSTWVTSLVALLLSDHSNSQTQHTRSIQWLLSQMNHQVSPVESLVLRLRCVPQPFAIAGGSPWLPGTAPWVAPTATAVLALQQADRLHPNQNLRPHIEQAQQYILCRRCRDGGWNHGGAPYLSENARSYPEMTGMALLALYGAPSAELALPLKLAEAQLINPESNEALCWLTLALVRHGRPIRSEPPNLPCRNHRDIALRLLTLAARSPTNRLVTA